VPTTRNELPLIEAWIYTRLSGDATVAGRVGSRIYAYQAPERTACPLVLFNYQGPDAGGDSRGIGTARVMARAAYQIKIITRSAPLDADIAVADRIDTIFQGAVTEESNGYLFTARRLSPVSYLEQAPSSAEVFHHLGGLYVIHAHPA
jgi:hypothetical protein